jgi:hypothetical protein
MDGMRLHLGTCPCQHALSACHSSFLSTMEYFDLQALPFDILIPLFQFLDHRSLLAACLTSKTLHEIATPMLYEQIKLGPSPDCKWYRFLSTFVFSCLLRSCI